MITEAECGTGCYLGCHVWDVKEWPNLPSSRSLERRKSPGLLSTTALHDGIHFSTRTDLCSSRGPCSANQFRKCVGVGERSAYFHRRGTERTNCRVDPEGKGSASTCTDGSCLLARASRIIPSSSSTQEPGQMPEAFRTVGYFFCHGRGSVRNLWVGHWKIQLARKAPDRRAMSMKNESNGAPQIVNRAVGHGLGRGRR